MLVHSLYDVIKGCVYNQKSTELKERSNQYVFKIAKYSTKLLVKKAVEKFFDKEVISVNIINIKGKKKVFRGKKGFVSGVKKAVVRLAAGQEIDMESMLFNK